MNNDEIVENHRFTYRNGLSDEKDLNIEMKVIALLRMSLNVEVKCAKYWKEI